MNNDIASNIIKNLLSENPTWDTQNRRGARVRSVRPQNQPQYAETVPQAPVMPPVPPIQAVATPTAIPAPQPVVQAPVPQPVPQQPPTTYQPMSMLAQDAPPGMTNTIMRGTGAVQTAPTQPAQAQPVMRTPGMQPAPVQQTAARSMGNQMAANDPSIPKADGSATSALNQQTAINKKAKATDKKTSGKGAATTAGTVAGGVAGAAGGAGVVALALRNKINQSKSKIQTLKTQMDAESNAKRKEMFKVQVDKATEDHNKLMKKYRWAQAGAGVAGGAAGAYAGRKAGKFITKNFSGSKVLAGIKDSLNKIKR